MLTNGMKKTGETEENEVGTSSTGIVASSKKQFDIKPNRSVYSFHGNNQPDICKQQHVYY